MPRHNFIISTRQKADELIRLDAPLAALSTFESAIRKIAGYSAVKILAVAAQPFQVRVEEACAPDGTFGLTHTFSSALDPSTGLQSICESFSPCGAFVRFFLENLAAAASDLDLCIIGLPEGGGGETGPAGPSGPQGFQGNQGPSEAGFQGPQGPQSQGVQGPQGNQGPSEAGFQGPQGFQADGVQGPQGSQGPSQAGVQGPQGFQGLDGAGAQGFQGFQGPSSGGGAQGLFLNNQEATVVTTDATPTSVVSETIPDGTVGVFRAVFDMRYNDGTQRAGFVMTARAHREGAGAVIGVPSSDYTDDSTLGAVSVNIVAIGNDVVAQVTGVAATGITWKARMGRVLLP